MLTAGLVNLGLDAGLLQVDGDLTAFTVSEVRQGGTDLNGDGDAFDNILHVANANTGAVTNLGLSILGLHQVDGSLVAFTVNEASQGGTDLNGDGDAVDLVQHLFDASTGIVTNLGIATSPFFASQLDGDSLAFVVSESAEGNTDLNGDGDVFDHVPHVYDVSSGNTNNLELALGGGTPQLVGNLLAFQVRESWQASTDLNGDGDVLDLILHVHDIGSGSTDNLGLQPGFGVSMSEDLVAFGVKENGLGVDLNADGDINDTVSHVYITSTGTTVNLAIAGATPLVDGTVAAWKVSETGQGSTDLNGDGDTHDIVWHVYDTVSGTTTNLGLATNPFQEALQDGRLAFFVLENQQGNADLNGDGDATDQVLHVYDANTQTINNFGLAAFSVVFNGSLAAVRVTESGQGGVDLNGDGDTNDLIVHVVDVVNNTAVNVGLTVFSLSSRIENGRLAFSVSETGEGKDLNGDGDVSDRVLFAYDASTGTAANLRLATSFSGFSLSGNHLSVGVNEASQGNEDLNGDADTDDSVMHLVRLSSPLSNVPVIESVDVGAELKSMTIQLNETDLDEALATDVANYRVRTSGGDGNGDGDLFNDGDEGSVTVNSASYDAGANRVTLELADAVFAEVFRVEIDGDDSASDGTSGLANRNAFFLHGGDFQTDFDFRVLTFVEALLDKVESLGLSTGGEQSLTGRLTAATNVLGADVDNDSGLVHILESFRLGVQHAFERGELAQVDRDELLEDVDFVLLGLSLTSFETVNP